MEDAALQEAHRTLSAQCFNACWELIDKTDRTELNLEDMRSLAYASLWHWKQRADCTDQNRSVGYWQVSRVEALAGYGNVARDYAEKCLMAARRGALAPFYVGYAFEALARAASALGDADAASGQLEAARAELAQGDDPESAELLRADIEQLQEALHSIT